MKITNAQEWWDSFPPIDRKNFLNDLFINKELAEREFSKLPGHIRLMFYGRFEKKIKPFLNKEIQF